MISGRPVSFAKREGRLQFPAASAKPVGKIAVPTRATPVGSTSATRWNTSGGRTAQYVTGGRAWT